MHDIATGKIALVAENPKFLRNIKFSHTNYGQEKALPEHKKLPVCSSAESILEELGQHQSMLKL